MNPNAKKAVREPLVAPERSGEGSAAGEGGEIPNVGTQLTKEEALEASEFLSALFAKLSDPKPDEYARLMARLDGVVDPTKPPPRTLPPRSIAQEERSTTDAERDTFIALLAKVASNLKAHDEKQSRCGS